MTQGNHGGARLLETRVVIFDNERGPEVGVVEIPYPATVGAEFEHGGRCWRVCGRRDRTRVLLAIQNPCDDHACLRA